MHRRLGIIASVFVLGACGGSQNQGPDRPRADGGNSSGADGASSSSAEGGASEGGNGRVPVNHRPNADHCLAPAPAGNCCFGFPCPPQMQDGGFFLCVGDSYCTAGTNGRCSFFGGPAGCRCNYDTCMQDIDCPTGQTCACHDSPYHTQAGNTCVEGNCRVDADCSPGTYCSPTVPAGYCGHVGGYYCHTPNDLCIDDSDCGNQGGLSDVFCAYSKTNGRWECQHVNVCA